MSRRSNAVYEQLLSLCRAEGAHAVSAVQAALIEAPASIPLLIDAITERKFTNTEQEANLIQGASAALIGQLPASHPLVVRLMRETTPHSVYELQFSMFVHLERARLNPLEQDGIELLLAEYLMNATSTRGYAAWKAGLVLAEEWLSPRSEKLLLSLMINARYPAGRLGAINGYRFIVQRRKTFTDAELRPLRKLARSDPSTAVRSAARFDLRNLSKLRTTQGGS